MLIKVDGKRVVGVNLATLGPIQFDDSDLDRVVAWVVAGVDIGR
jgi:hypothetical protein